MERLHTGGQASRLRGPRLILVPATLDLLHADLAAFDASSAAPLAVALGAAPPDHWPPDLLERDDVERCLKLLTDRPDAVGWSTWYILDATGAMPRLAGIIGFGGSPDDAGQVMFGYSVLPSAQRRGFATEATRMLVNFAFQNPRVRTVVAETFETLIPSIRVLEKAGFQRVVDAAPVTPGAIRFEKARG